MNGLSTLSQISAGPHKLILTLRVGRWKAEAGPYQRDEVTAQQGPVLDSAPQPVPGSVGGTRSPTGWEGAGSDGARQKLTENLVELPDRS